MILDATDETRDASMDRILADISVDESITADVKKFKPFLVGMIEGMFEFLFDNPRSVKILF